ncbi:MAG: uridine diphosphate-N-acetylglucosamine-binding protein YvcK [Chloroflexota bacterium]|jgi:uncharacterized cofD-like protein|nr:uridine diphosphate-N-acetylglucosamine-binding protein YvcK [Chloroflexota bacterium]MEC8712830.1 uridine diphosphate-N-acetylglucosamine-binding protein YvcK [Chloroflexota bacterium]MEE2620171.1 uridine diphosphate-N-acetylglucosamine-binding protein YvcK [Chloroflexota bacterium]|tara:strand:+ start:4373 stop:5299 length:927 start_codon:yes stop_codon:yes gene_type:complete
MKNKITGIGGGTGLSTLFRGLRKKDLEISGIISVTDDGGSSGRLREGFGILPPGDFRNCLVALSDAEPLLKKLFQHRFEGNDPLNGHSFGNLFILAMEKITGNFETALEESCRILNVKGNLVPSTLDNIDLEATMKDGSRIIGESTIQKNLSGIEKIDLTPKNAYSNPKSIEIIRNSDYIIIGPGSLYTSIIPNFLVNGIVEAIHESNAKKILVCNVATQLSETDNFNAADHFYEIQKYTQNLKIDYFIVNNKLDELGDNFPTSSVVEMGDLSNLSTNVIKNNLMNDNFKGHHDSDKLSNEIMKIIKK